MPAEPLRLALSRTFLRTVNRVPLLKDGMFRAIGDE
jgi:hypothetical protein